MPRAVTHNEMVDEWAKISTVLAVAKRCMHLWLKWYSHAAASSYLNTGTLNFYGHLKFVFFVPDLRCVYKYCVIAVTFTYHATTAGQATAWASLCIFTHTPRSGSWWVIQVIIIRLGLVFELVAVKINVLHMQYIWCLIDSILIHLTLAGLNKKYLLLAAYNNYYLQYKHTIWCTPVKTGIGRLTLSPFTAWFAILKASILDILCPGRKLKSITKESGIHGYNI